MKIIAIGRNFAEHAKEMNNPVPTHPVIFMKPDTALIRDSKPFYYPSFSNNIQHEVELVLRICKEGKHIAEKFAHKYYDQVGIGIDFTARDIQQQNKEKGLPWELAKAFDGSAPVGNFKPVETLPDKQDINFHLLKNGEEVQRGNTSMMLFSFEQIISFVSQYITLKKGDLIFTGTPKGVASVKAGDKLEAFIENEKMLEVEVK